MIGDEEAVVAACSPPDLPEQTEGIHHVCPATTVAMNLLEEVACYTGESMENRRRARLLSNELYLHGDIYAYAAYEVMFSLPDMPRLLRIGLRLHGDSRMAGYYEEMRVDIAAALHDLG